MTARYYLAAEELGADSVDIISINRLAYDRGSIGLGGITSVMGMGKIPVYNQMFLEQAKIIQKLAAAGSSVFLGRCSGPDSGLRGEETEGKSVRFGFKRENPFFYTK